MSPACDSFESCDVAYRSALARAQQCHAQDDDCDDEDADANANYDALREQTELELDALRRETEDQDAALIEAGQDTEAARLAVRSECSNGGRTLETAPADRRGNGWFESEIRPGLPQSH